MLVPNKDRSYLSIYIHWPFCQAKCPYCDFNSHVRTSIDQKEWTQAYIKSLKLWKEIVPNFVVDTVFFGGGTPSMMKERTVYEIIQTIFFLWANTENIEITLEANPTSSEKATFSSYCQSGVNRLSLGIQAFNDLDLKRLGRMHSSKEAKEALFVATNLFDRVSFDLMYGRQFQTLSDWKKELKTATEFATEHLSLYQLTVEQGTRFGELLDRNQLHGLPSDKLSSKFYTATQEICYLSGLEAYEISNYATRGNECRHNLTYWNSGCFLGVGPGAHGRLNIGSKRYRTETPTSPEVWIEHIKKYGIEKFLKEPLSNTERAEEYAIMALRLSLGLDINKFQELGGVRLSTEKLRQLSEDNLVYVYENRLKTTAKGKLLTDQILRELLC